MGGTYSSVEALRMMAQDTTRYTAAEIRVFKDSADMLERLLQALNKFKEPSRPANVFANDAVNEKVVACVSDLRDDWLCIMNHNNSVHVVLENGDIISIDIAEEKLKGGGNA